MSFVNSLWLLAIGAMVWPVVFHLIRRQQFKRMELATLRFLVEANEERRSFRSIENWPLLMLRALVVALLALLLSRPFRTGDAVPRAENVNAVVLADVSGSQARSRGVDLPGTAGRWIDGLPPGSHLTLARFADEVETVKTPGELRVAPGAGTDFARGVQWTFDHLAQSNAPLTRVLIVSDFPRESLRQVTPRLWPPNVEVTLAQTGEANAWNAGIERVEFLTPVAVAELEADVIVKTSGQPPEGAFRVQLNLDGRAPLEQTLSAGQTRAHFAWKSEIPPQGQLVRGYAEIVGRADAVATDDRRPFAFSATRQRAVLLVDGDPGESVFAGETYFLGKALGVTSVASEVAAFRSEVRQHVGDLAGYDAVALCNVRALSSADAAALAAFVGKGGGLFISAGEQTTREFFDTLAVAGLTFGGLSRVTSPALHRSTILDPAHGSVPMPRDEVAESWRQLEFWQAFAFQPATTAKTIMAFEDGTPLLVEAAAGRALAFLHPVTRKRSEFSREPLFAPWMREVFRYLVHASEPPWRVREVAMSLREQRAPGIYGDAADLEVVVPVAGEIEVVPATLDEARTALGLTAQAAAVREQRQAAAEALVPQQLRPRELWPVAALALFAFLLVESLLAAQAASRNPKLV
jgi:hypothetical protein